MRDTKQSYGSLMEVGASGRWKGIGGCLYQLFFQVCSTESGCLRLTQRGRIAFFRFFPERLRLHTIFSSFPSPSKRRDCESWFLICHSGHYSSTMPCLSLLIVRLSVRYNRIGCKTASTVRQRCQLDSRGAHRWSSKLSSRHTARVTLSIHC
jgi:hypothetical protein